MVRAEDKFFQWLATALLVACAFVLGNVVQGTVNEFQNQERIEQVEKLEAGMVQSRIDMKQARVDIAQCRADLTVAYNRMGD